MPDTSLGFPYPDPAAVPDVPVDVQALADALDSYLVGLPSGFTVVNVKDHGALGNGSHDDTVAIQAALDAASALTYGGIVYLPPGEYKVTAQLTLTNQQLVSIHGAGKNASFIHGTNAIGANSVLKVSNGRNVAIERLRVDGGGTTTTACIEAHRNTSGGVTNRAMRLSDVRLDNSQIGFQATGALDANNDFHELSMVECNNMSVAGVSFEHFNSTWHHISDLRVSTAPIAVRTRNGPSFKLFGGIFETVTTLFDLEGNASHLTTIVGVNAEACGSLLVTTSDAILVSMFSVSMYGTSHAPTNIIDFAAEGADQFNPSRLTMVGCHIYTGASGAHLNFSNRYSHVTLVGSLFQVTEVHFEGFLSEIDVVHGSTADYYPGTYAIHARLAGNGATNYPGYLGLGGIGVPDNAKGADGELYLRGDGGSMTTIYQRRSGAWVGIV